VFLLIKLQFLKERVGYEHASLCQIHSISDILTTGEIMYKQQVHLRHFFTCIFLTLLLGMPCFASVLEQYLQDNIDGEFDDGNPTWSHDGKLIAFERRIGISQQGIYCLNRWKEKLPTAEIAKPTHIQKVSGYFCWAQAAPSSERYRFIFAREANLYIGSIDERMKVGKQHIFAALRDNKGIPIVLEDADWSMQHDYIIFWAGRGNGDIYLKNLRDPISIFSEEELRLTENDDGLDMSSRWAPSGETILYVSQGQGKQHRSTTNLYLLESIISLKDNKAYVNPHSAWHAKQLTNYDTSTLLPSWSPDGEKIAFYRVQSKETYSLWVINADGTNGREVVSRVYKQQPYGPSWLPQKFGHKLIYIPEEQQSIHIVDVDTGVDIPIGLSQHSAQQEVISDVRCAPNQKEYGNGIWIAYSAPYKSSRGRMRIFWEVIQLKN
jgi:Tol biopolymer transport system component